MSSNDEVIPDDPFTGAEVIWLSPAQFDMTLARRMVELAPEGAQVGVSEQPDGRAWVMVSSPGDTRELVTRVLAELGRPALA